MIVWPTSPIATTFGFAHTNTGGSGIGLSFCSVRRGRFAASSGWIYPRRHRRRHDNRRDARPGDASHIVAGTSIKPVGADALASAADPMALRRTVDSAVGDMTVQTSARFQTVYWVPNHRAAAGISTMPVTKAACKLSCRQSCREHAFIRPQVFDPASAHSVDWA